MNANTSIKKRQEFIEELFKIYPETKEGIMATIILNNGFDALKLTAGDIARFERRIGNAPKKRMTDIKPGDSIFDLKSGQWEEVHDICIYELLRAINPKRISEKYDKRVIKWIHVTGALFAPAAAVRRFANNDGYFYVLERIQK